MKKAVAASLALLAPEQVQNFELDWKKLKLQDSDAFKSIQIGKYKFSAETELMDQSEYKFMDFISKHGR